MKSVVLVEENVGRYCPVTNHYRCSDGRYLLVTYPRLDVLGTLAGMPGMPDALAACGIAVTQISRHQMEQMVTEVFLADENAVVVDADGDPANGMTPLLRCDAAIPIADALAQLGYTETPE